MRLWASILTPRPSRIFGAKELARVEDQPDGTASPPGTCKINFGPLQRPRYSQIAPGTAGHRDKERACTSSVTGRDGKHAVGCKHGSWLCARCTHGGGLTYSGIPSTPSLTIHTTPRLVPEALLIVANYCTTPAGSTPPSPMSQPVSGVSGNSRQLTKAFSQPWDVPA